MKSGKFIFSIALMLNKNDNLLDEFDEEVEVEGPINKGKRVLLIIVPVAIILVSLMIYGILRFTKSEVSSQNQAKAAAATKLAEEYVFIEIDDIIVSLSSSSSKKNFLKTSLSLQVKNKSDAEVVNAKLPIIKDSFQLFLRELRPSDLSGSAGVLMLKNELLKRINKIVSPIEVTDVLFKEILLS